MRQDKGPSLKFRKSHPSLSLCPQFRYPGDFDHEKFNVWLRRSGISAGSPLQAGLIEMTIPDKPRSSKQRYRLTPAGSEYLRRIQEA